MNNSSILARTRHLRHFFRFQHFLNLARIVSLFMFILLAVSPALAMPGGETIKPIAPAELESFIDDYLAEQMEAHQVAGAAVSVVQNGQVILAKGYGYADVENQIPVNPDKTVFRIGSISKLFTWTAVMQLAEQGKLDLNADINTYLDFTIPDTFSDTITLNHLMAHTPGFEDRNFSQMSTSTGEITPTDEWLKTHIPARVRPPGEFSSYSNYGATLAGYIVERVSGLPYDDYVEQNILSPLNMARSTSRQPVPTTFAPDLSEGYEFIDGQYQAQPFETVNVVPAGGLSSTASDMAHFMIAHLQNGLYKETKILQAETAQQMHTQHFTHDPRLPGWAHGFMEINANGNNAISHSGDTVFFHSFMMLLPEQELGFFITTNSAGGAEITIPFVAAVIEHYFPQTVPPITASTDFAQRVDRFTGSYRASRMSYTTPEKLVALLTAVDIRADENGLIFNSDSGEQHFVEIEPLVFRQVDDDSMLIFKEDEHGNIVIAFYSLFPHMALEKNLWYETPLFNLSVLGASLLLFLSFLLPLPVRLYKLRTSTSGTSEKRLNWSSQLAAGSLSFLSLVIPILVFLSVQNFINLLTGTMNLWLFVQIISILVALLTVVCVVFAAQIWLKKPRSLLWRIHYMLVAAAGVGFTWFLYFWNLLGKGF